ncbi:MAG: hypothetical protein RJA36_448 [Pseudomonadota bacterium]|jgi:threonine/homoserine/homoserine lactone efflux protein
MSFNTWWLFVLMTFVVSATPGPNMLLVMTTGAHHGLRAAMASMAGCMSALLAMMSLSATGLGTLLQAFPALFDALRLAGAGPVPSGRRLAPWLRQPRFMRGFNRLCGAVFVGFAFLMAVSGR